MKQVKCLYSSAVRLLCIIVVLYSFYQSSCTLLAQEPLYIEFEGNAYVIPSFDDAMICNECDKSSYARMYIRNNFLKLAHSQYDKYIFNGMELSVAPRIPKIIHQIWIGPNTPPHNFQAWRDTLLKVHPDWIYMFWDEEKIALLDLENRHFIEQENNYGAKSDLIRYEIIYQFGGLYLDIDFSGLDKPFDFLHHCCDFYGSFLEVKRFYGTPRTANGIFAASEHHPLVKALIDNAKHYRGKKDLLRRVGPDYFKAVLLKYLPTAQGRNVILPPNYFFSWSKRSLHIKPETLAVHHYTGTWKSPKARR